MALFKFSQLSSQFLLIWGKPPLAVARFRFSIIFASTRSTLLRAILMVYVLLIIFELLLWSALGVLSTWTLYLLLERRSSHVFPLHAYFSAF